MSGQQIGTVVGAVIGGYFFGPAGAQIGGAIGGYVGGAIDPTEIFGPRLTDAANQTAMDGVPRTYGYGTFPTAGNLIWCSELKERKRTQSSKGSPTEQITYQYLRSYAIAVCEGPADGNGIAGYRIVKRNGKVVYDTRTDEELTSLGYTATQIAETRAAQAKWLNKATFYYGVADQAPDPTIQAVKGVDETPGYSYTAYMVVRNEDVTELRGAVPQYEFIVSVCGDRTEDFAPPGHVIVTGQYSGGGGPSACVSRMTTELDFQPIATSTGYDIQAGVLDYREGVWVSASESEVRYSTNPLEEWNSGSIAAGRAVDSTMITRGGITVFAGNTFPCETHWAQGGSDFSFELTDPQSSEPSKQSFLDSGMRAWKMGIYTYIAYARTLFRSEFPGTEQWELIFDSTGSGNADDVLVMFLDMVQQGSLIYAITRSHGFDYQVRYSSDNGETWPNDQIVFSRALTDGNSPIQLCKVLLRDQRVALVAYCSGGGVWTSIGDWSEFYDLGIAGPVPPSGLLPENVRGGRRIVDVGYAAGVIGFGDDGDKCVKFDPDTGTILGTYTLPIVNAVSIATSYGDEPGDPIPDAPGYYVDPDTGEVYGPGGVTISQCAPYLSEIVEDQCGLRDVTSIDVTELDQAVLGFRIANTSSPQKNILAAQPGYFFDSSEFDGVLHFPLRGAEDSFHIPYAEMCQREPQAIQWERMQEAELLRKVTFTYFDPRTTYTPTSQNAERRAGTIKAMGQSASQLPMVGTGDWAAQAADINLKAAWAEPDDCTFHVSLDWAELVTAAVGTIEDENGTIHRVRIEEINDEGLVRMVKAKRTDSAAYQSNAGGKPTPLPTFPGSDLRGPTTWGLLNIPAVLDIHDRPGLYWAAAGTFSSWAGASLQVQRAGEWVTISATIAGATVGTLASELPYHGGDLDTINTLSLRINSQLESVTYTQLLSERNPLAIAYSDGTAEVVQFQDAEIDTDGVWQCTTLLRGRLNTVAAVHEAGARVVALDTEMQFVDLRPDDLGKTLTFRVVGAGTDPDTATPFDMTLDRIWSSTEWEVAELDVERDGDDFTVSWVPRHRLGTDVNPIRSGNWDGFLVRWQHSDQFFEEIITDTTKTYNLPGASNVTFTVAQLNRLTGAGPETTVTIP